MEVAAEQVFTVNSAQNQDASSTSMQRIFTMPLMGNEGNDDTVLHSFPNPDKDMHRYLEWTVATGIDTSLNPQYVFKHRRVCHDHFEQKYKTWSRRLSLCAVPTLLLPDSNLARVLLLETTNQEEFDSLDATLLCTSFTPKELQTNSLSNLAHPSTCPSSRNMCRLCATVTELVVPIFEGEGLQHGIAKKINQHLPIQVSEDDMLPMVMCFQCTSTLLAWHELVVCCVQADNAMREQLNLQNSASKQQQQQQQQEQPNVQDNENENEDSKATTPPASTASDASTFAATCDSTCPETGKIPVSTGSDEENDPRTPTALELTTDPEEPRAASPLSPPERAGDFSDRSDTENDFGRLPESVLRAIEDPREVPPPETAAARACPECGKLCRSLSGWYQHRRHAHGSRRLPCAECGKEFASRATLAAHARTHSGERPFACRTCGAGFASRAGRYIHEQTHATRRAHACGTCGRAFRWRAALARHEARHGAPSLRCAACGRAFALPSDLRRHARAHAPGAHRCPLCPAVFKQTRYLKVHLGNVHARAAASDDPKAKSVPEVIRNGESPSASRSPKVPATIDDSTCGNRSTRSED